MKGRMQKHWLPWLVGMPTEICTAICVVIFGGVLEQFPNLKVCFTHAGESFPFTVERTDHGFNVRPDLSAVENNVNPRQYLGKFYTDTPVHELKLCHF